MADTDQAPAGAETAEPGGLGPRRSLLPPLPEALRVLFRRVLADLSGHAVDYLTGVRSGLVVALCGWLLAAALTLSLWATAAPDGADPWVPVRISGQLWLASHHVLMHAVDGPFGLSPLGFTLLPLLGLFAAGRRTARRSPAFVPRATIGAAVGYAIVACIVADCSSDSGLHPQYAQVVLYPVLLALIGHGAGSADAIRELIPGAAVRLWPPYAGRGAVAALAVWIGSAAFAAAAAVVVHAGALADVGRATGGGTVGATGLFLIDLALVPNAMLWAGAVLIGPGFALGTGTSVTVFSVVHGPLPGLPLLAATPTSQHPSMWWLALFLVPLLAGATGTWVIARSVPAWSDRFGSAGAMAALCGLAAGVSEMYAGGPVAFGPMSLVGSTAWLVGVLAALEFGLAASIVLGLCYVVPRLGLPSLPSLPSMPSMPSLPSLPSRPTLSWRPRSPRGPEMAYGCEVVSVGEEDDPPVFVVAQRQEEPVVVEPVVVEPEAAKPDETEPAAAAQTPEPEPEAAEPETPATEEP